MPEDYAEFARIIARNFPEQIMVEESQENFIHIQDMDFQDMRESGRPETFTVAWIPGLGKIDIVFTPDF